MTGGCESVVRYSRTGPKPLRRHHFGPRFSRFAVKYANHMTNTGGNAAGETRPFCIVFPLANEVAGKLYVAGSGSVLNHFLIARTPWAAAAVHMHSIFVGDGHEVLS
jgi:hypothetical protein